MALVRVKIINLRNWALRGQAAAGGTGGSGWCPAAIR